MFTRSNSITDFLFSTPSFLIGAGTVLNLAGNYYHFNESATSDEADYLAIKNDFCIVGDDFKEAITNVVNIKLMTN